MKQINAKIFQFLKTHIRKPHHRVSVTFICPVIVVTHSNWRGVPI